MQRPIHGKSLLALVVPYNPTYGARPLRRAVMRLLEDSLAEEVLSEKIKAGDTAVVDVGEDNKVTVLLGDKFEVLQES